MNPWVFYMTPDINIHQNVTRGIWWYFREEGKTYRPSTVVIDCCLIRLNQFVRLYEEGVHLITPSIRQIPPQCLDMKMKHRSRMHFALADLEVKALDPEASCLLLDLDGNVAETWGSNFWVIKNDVLITPKTKNILEGVSRATVFELAEKLGLKAIEDDLQTHQVYNADEAFQTASSYCVCPVTKFNGVNIGNGKAGPITKKLLDVWGDLVGVNLMERASRHTT